MRFFTLLLLPPLAMCGDIEDHPPGDRVASALQRSGPTVMRAFRDAGAAWPPRGVFLRALKAEGVVELWARPPGDTRRVRVRTFPVCAPSGRLGPKARSGDLQVPEGFYRVDRFNPRSRFHLSLGLDYPNAVDLARTPPGASPGGDIFIHGGCATIGCLPLRDGPMEQLYLAADAAREAGQRTIPVHVFPCRMDTVSCQLVLANRMLEDPALGDFWGTGYLRFERTRIPPRVRLRGGRYILPGDS